MSACCGCEDIHTLHAALVHAASEIQFALEYPNGADTATITDIGKLNLQEVLESYFSQLGVPILHERPMGDRGCPGDVVFETYHEFIPDTLQVVLSGMVLNGDQADPKRDFTILPGNKSFRIEIDPTDRERLSAAPGDAETFFVNYRKRITFNTRGGT